MYIASQKGEHKCLEVLIKAGADVNKAKKVEEDALSQLTPVHQKRKRTYSTKREKQKKTGEQEVDEEDVCAGKGGGVGARVEDRARKKESYKEGKKERERQEEEGAGGRAGRKGGMCVFVFGWISFIPLCVCDVF